MDDEGSQDYDGASLASSDVSLTSTERGFDQAIEEYYEDPENETLRNNAIEVLRDLVNGTGIFHGAWEQRVLFLGRALLDRAGRTRSTEDFDEALNRFREVAKLGSDEGDVAEAKADTSRALHAKFEVTREIEDLEEAIKISREVLEITPTDHNDKSLRLHNLSQQLYSLAEESRLKEDLEEAISAYRKAIDATADDDSSRVQRLSNLGVALQHRHEMTKSIDDIAEAMKIQEEAVATCPERDPILPSLLHNLSMSLYIRYRSLRSMDDLDRAIQLSEKAVLGNADGIANKGSYLALHGMCLMSRATRVGNIKDLEEGIQLNEQALEIIPGQPSWLHNRAAGLQDKFKRTGSLEDLEPALDAMRTAEAAISEGLPTKFQCQQSLAVLLHDRYTRLGSMEDIQEGIQILRNGIIVHKDDSTLPLALSTLAELVYCRYRQTDASDDLQEAILVADRALNLTPEHDPNRLYRLNNLLVYRDRRFRLSGNQEDLEESLRRGRELLSIIPDDDPNRPIALHNHAASLWSRYKQTKSMEDVLEAISATETAIQLCPPGHPSIPAFQNSLSNHYNFKFSQTKSLEDLNKAIGINQEALASIPLDHPSRGPGLRDLALKLEARYEAENKLEDLEAAAEYLLAAWNSQAAIPSFRIKSAAAYIKMLAPLGKEDAAITLGPQVMQLLPFVNTKILRRDDKQQVISAFAGVASDLCAIFLKFGRVEDALEYLEEGRAVILGELIDSYSDISILSHNHAELAQKYDMLRNKVNSAIVVDEEDGHEREQMIEQRLKDTADMNTCVQEIREIPGHERFLLGQTLSEMQACAAGGTIVVVNITESRSDAILIQPSLVRAINLSELSGSEAKSWLAKIGQGRDLKEQKRIRNTARIWLGFGSVA